MTYYVLANQFDGSFIQISVDKPNPGADQIIIERDGDISEIGNSIWVTSDPTNLRVLTKLAFMRRLTQDERATIYNAESTDIHVKVWLDMFRLASEINLDDPDLIQSIKLFELAGMIKPGRSMEILT